MADEFEGKDFTDAVFWGVDLTNATMRDVNFTGARMKSVWMVDVDIDGLVDRLVVNGVDVTAYVNEHDPSYPLRGMLRPTDVACVRAALDALDAAWAATIDHARSLTEAQQHQSVNDEFSFVETQQHLVFGVDKWFSAPVLGHETFHAIGLPNTGSRDFGWFGLDLGARPTLDETLAVRAEQSEQIRTFVDDLTVDDFSREVTVLENGTVPLIECFYTVFEESFEHHRYALRDLAQLK
ncbi:MAG TPA: DinB family protein [Ilumatobacteraceae bacterium]|nr:DinB family protein [Ilumatobacteraceae bacterium]HRB02553.1 DinB family protein [Ilumatobacteraceae bacterium]